MFLMFEKFQQKIVSTQKEWILQAVLSEKSETKEQTYCDSIYIKFPNWQTTYMV